MNRVIPFLLALCLPVSANALNVFSCEPEWAALVEELAGDKVEITLATTAFQDPHMLQARPSLIAGARNADLLVCTGADGAPALADGEPQLLIHGDGRVQQLHLDADVVAGHAHLGPAQELGRAGDVGGAEVELRAVAREERRVAATLLLGQHVDAGGELGVRLDGAGLGEDLAALDLVALDAAEQAADVVAGLARVEQLVEHLYAGDHDLAGVLDPAHLYFLVDGLLDTLESRFDVDHVG